MDAVVGPTSSAAAGEEKAGPVERERVCVCVCVCTCVSVCVKEKEQSETHTSCPLLHVRALLLALAPFLRPLALASSLRLRRGEFSYGDTLYRDE